MLPTGRSGIETLQTQIDSYHETSCRSKREDDITRSLHAQSIDGDNN